MAYVKTEWHTGDKVTASKLNKLETAVEDISKNGGGGGSGVTVANIVFGGTAPSATEAVLDQAGSGTNTELAGDSTAAAPYINMTCAELYNAAQNGAILLKVSEVENNGTSYFQFLIPSHIEFWDGGESGCSIVCEMDGTEAAFVAASADEYPLISTGDDSGVGESL